MNTPTIETLPPPPIGKTGWPWTSAPAPINISPSLTLPSISIVTPSYNQGIFIEETIRSVLLQGYPNVEYIIIDGGSKDETVEIIKKYEPWIKYWVSEPDKGQTDAINKGLLKCGGEVFNWLNSDDYYEPNALLKIGQAFALQQESLVVCGKENVFDSETGKIKFINEGSRVLETLEETIFVGHIDQPSTFFKRQVIAELGNQLTTSLQFVMDAELYLRFLLQFGQEKIIKIDDILVNFRHHDASKTVSLTTLFVSEKNAVFSSLLAKLNAPEELIQIINKNITSPIKYQGSKWPTSSYNTDKIIAIFCFFYMFEYYKNAEYKKSRKLLSFYLKNGNIHWSSLLIGLIIRLYTIRLFS